MLEVATICVQTGLNPLRYILENPCHYVRCHCLNFFDDVCFQGVCFVISFGKLSLSDILIRNNQAASDRVSAMAKVPSKWRGRRKRTEFLSCWRVKCGMSLHPSGSILLRFPHRPIDLQRFWNFPYMRLFWKFLRRRWDQLCVAGTSHTKHQSSLNEGVFHASRCDFHLSKGRVYQNKTTNHRRLESKYHRRNSGSDRGSTSKDFPKYSARVHSCPDPNGGHFQHMLWCRHISHTMS